MPELGNVQYCMTPNTLYLYTLVCIYLYMWNRTISKRFTVHYNNPPKSLPFSGITAGNYNRISESMKASFGIFFFFFTAINTQIGQYINYYWKPIYMNIHIYDLCENRTILKRQILQSPPIIAIIFQQPCHQCVINLHWIHECFGCLATIESYWIRIKFAMASITTSQFEFHMSSNVQYCMIHNTQLLYW